MTEAQTFTEDEIRTRVAEKFTSYEFYSLQEAPTLSLLQALPEIPNEVMLIQSDDGWLVIKGFEEGFAPWIGNRLPENISIHIHSHPKHDLDHIPSLNDFQRLSDSRKVFICCSKGIVQLSGNLNQDNIQLLEQLAMKMEDGQLDAENYVQILEENNLSFTLNEWEQIDEKGFVNLFSSD